MGDNSGGGEMVTLYVFGPAFGLPDASPFVIKAELLLKMAGIEYEIKTADYRKAPKGKLPYIADEGKIVSDSTFIRSHLENKYDHDFDRELNKEQQAIAWAVEKMIEEHLYWSLVTMRWMDDDNFRRGPRALLRGAVPAVLRPFLVPMLRRGIARQLHGQGFGRHTSGEVTELGIRSIKALSSLIGDRPYLMGSNHSGVDAAAFGVISGILCRHFESPLRSAAESYQNIVSYNSRMFREFYSEFEPGSAV